MDSKQLVDIAIEACDDKKAINTIFINISNVSSLAEWILITEGLSDAQVRSITQNIEKKIKSHTNISPYRKEGLNQAKWTLLDYGDVIINVLRSKERSFYNLEAFWSNGVIHKYEPKSDYL